MRTSPSMAVPDAVSLARPLARSHGLSSSDYPPYAVTSRHLDLGVLRRALGPVRRINP